MSLVRRAIRSGQHAATVVVSEIVFAGAVTISGSFNLVIASVYCVRVPCSAVDRRFDRVEPKVVRRSIGRRWRDVDERREPVLKNGNQDKCLENLLGVTRSEGRSRSCKNASRGFECASLPRGISSSWQASHGAITIGGHPDPR